MFIYTQLVIKKDNVDVEVTETAFPDKNYRIDNVSLKKGDGTFGVFKDNRLMLSG